MTGTQESKVRSCLALGDEQLRRECEVDTYRASGPGGQHRNKTESAVRLRHRMSGIVVTAEERRSQHENLAKALGRLREAIAVQVRAPLPESVSWPPTVQVRDQKLRVSENNPGYFYMLGIGLDALQHFQGSPQQAAAYFGVTGTSFTRFLAKNTKAWNEANRIRLRLGLGSLHS